MMFEMEDMLPFVLDRLSAKNPTSILRFGDGECILLDYMNDKETAKHVMKRQLGYTPHDRELDLIRFILIGAYREANVIGIPVSNRYMDDPKNPWAKANDILGEAVGLRILQNKFFTNIDFHTHWLNNNCFRDLLYGRENLCYISCRNLDEQLKDRFQIKNIYSYHIAPEMKFEPSYLGKPHFPEQYNEIRSWMDTVPVNGNLCLVGAGIVGKVYNNWFRDRGGISVDVGSVFDSWAGKKTRGEGRGADAVDETFKL